MLSFRFVIKVKRKRFKSFNNRLVFTRIIKTLIYLLNKKRGINSYTIRLYKRRYLISLLLNLVI